MTMALHSTEAFGMGEDEPKPTFSQHDAEATLRAFRARQKSKGGDFDCIHVWLTVPEEGVFDGCASCIHERTLIGPRGTAEQFAAELDEFIRGFQERAYCKRNFSS